jgi:hypothetical protein
VLDNTRQMEYEELKSVTMSLWNLVHSGKQSL